MDEAVSDFLEHHGVKGMHWGVRKGRVKKGKGSKKRTQFEKAPHRLSDEELNRRIKRLDLEKRYSELNAPTKSAGKKYTHDLLQQTGKTVVTGAVAGTAGYFLKRALTKKFPAEVAKKTVKKTAKVAPFLKSVP